GTYPVRVDFNNDYYDQPNNQDRNLLLNNFTFSTSSSGANLSVVNPTTSATLNQTVLSAADSYIQNYRQGPAALTLRNSSGTALPQGTVVHVQYKGQQTNPTFNFGTAVYGTSNADAGWLTDSIPTANDIAYKNFLNTHFNDIEPENAGKWGLQEATQN